MAGTAGLAAAFVAIAIAAAPATAATIPALAGAPDGTSADGMCSLREAITSAWDDGGEPDCVDGETGVVDTVSLGPGTYEIGGTGDDGNATGDLDVNASMVISGAGAAATTVHSNGLDRVFDVRSGTVTISGLTVTGGHAPKGADGSGATPGQAGASGGGIQNAAALLLSGVAVTGNASGDGGNGAANGNDSTPGGRGGNGGGIATSASMTIENSTISGNATGNGGTTVPATSGTAGYGGAGGDGGGDDRGPRSPPRDEEGEGAEIEAHRGMTAHEGAVARALVGRQHRRREALRAAELGHLRGARAAPMVLQHRVDEKPGPESEAEEQEGHRLAVEPEERPLAQQPPEEGDEHEDDDCLGEVGDEEIDESEGRPVLQEEAVARPVEQPARPEVDAGEGEEDRGRDPFATGCDRPQEQQVVRLPEMADQRADPLDGVRRHLALPREHAPQLLVVLVGEGEIVRLFDHDAALLGLADAAAAGAVHAFEEFVF